MTAAERREYVRRVVDDLPPLTDEQRRKLALILRKSGGRQ